MSIRDHVVVAIINTDYSNTFIEYYSCYVTCICPLNVVAVYCVSASSPTSSPCGLDSSYRGHRRRTRERTVDTAAPFTLQSTCCNSPSLHTGGGGTKDMCIPTSKCVFLHFLEWVPYPYHLIPTYHCFAKIDDCFFANTTETPTLRAIDLNTECTKFIFN